MLDKKGIEYYETASLEEAMPTLDVLYMTRVQRERFFNEEDYLRLKDSYILVPEKLKNAKEDLSILHPLPRVNEISVKIDSDKRACYFIQALNGKYMRMALILKLLDSANDKNTAIFADTGEIIRNEIECKNPRCITSCEQEIEHIFKVADKENNICRCIYCETKAK